MQFVFQPHPRDNMFKLLLRHRDKVVLGWVKGISQKHNGKARLIISAYSSALVTESCKNDMLLNVRIGNPGDVTLREYCWVPTIDVQSLNSISEYINVFHRSS